MKKIIVSLAIAAVVAFAPQTQAAPKTGGTSKGSVAKSTGPSSKPTNGKPSGTSQPTLGKGAGTNKVVNYHQKHATKFEHGHFYKGKHHNHWGEVRFDHRYGCNCYWDSCLATWYYWCERDICYYPVSHCPYRCYVCPPVVVEPVRPVVIVEPVRPVVVVWPVCECHPTVVCTCGASYLRGSVLATGHYSPPIHHGPRHPGVPR